jgi:hypothetical protein
MYHHQNGKIQKGKCAFNQSPKGYSWLDNPRRLLNEKRIVKHYFEFL